MAKKNAKKMAGGDDSSESNDQFTAQEVQTVKPVKSGNGSTLLLWIAFIAVTIALSLGFTTIIEERSETAAIQMKELQEQIATLANSQVDLQLIKNAVQSVQEVKESMRLLKKEQSSLDEVVQPLSSAFTELQQQFSKDKEDRKQLELNEQAKSGVDKKISAIENNVASMPRSLDRMESKLKQLEETSNSRLSKLEQNQRKFEADITAKNVHLETSTNDKLSELQGDLHKFKLLSDTISKDVDDVKMELAHDIAPALKRTSGEFQQIQEGIKKTEDRLEAVEGNLSQSQASGNGAEIDELNKEVSDVKTSLRHLSDSVKQSDQKVGAQITSLVNHLKQVDSKTAEIKKSLEPVDTNKKEPKD